MHPGKSLATDLEIKHSPVRVRVLCHLRGSVSRLSLLGLYYDTVAAPAVAAGLN